MEQLGVLTAVKEMAQPIVKTISDVITGPSKMDHEKELLKLKNEDARKKRKHEAAEAAADRKQQKDLQFDEFTQSIVQSVAAGTSAAAVNGLCQFIDSHWDRAHQKELKEMEHKEAARKREHEEEEKNRQREHEKHLKNMKHELEEKKIQLEKKKLQQEKELKNLMIEAKKKDVENQLEQRREAMANIQKRIEEFKQERVKDEQKSSEISGKLQEIQGKLEIDSENIAKFDRDFRLKTEKQEMDKAEQNYKRSDEEIVAAITKTGQDEDNVGRFLRLTQGLIGGTTNAQANADRLDAEMQTFQSMIEQQCQDKLEIKYYFKNHDLERLVPILAEQGIVYCHALKCKDDEEFKEKILHPIQEEISKQIKEWKKRNPNKVGGDPWDIFLEKYKLSKFKQGLSNAGLESLDDLVDIETDEDINEVIDEAGITGLFKKKFKRAINDVRTGKYKPPQPGDGAIADNANEKEESDEKVSNKEEDKKPKPFNFGEKNKLEEFCLKSESNWEKEKKDKQIAKRTTLEAISPILADFFIETQDAVQQAQELLKLEVDLVNEQKETMRAITAPEAETKADAIVNESDDDNDEGDDNKEEKINAVDDHPIAVESRVIMETIEVKMDVVRSFNNRFISAKTKVAKPIVIGVEDSVIAILKSQSQIRESLRLAGAILQLKPANLTDISKPLWDAVDDGIIQIIKSFIQVNKISVQFFGYLLIIGHAFQEFTSMITEKKDISLLVSLEPVRKSIEKFSKDKKQFDAVLAKLSYDAAEVIKRCVKKHIGAEKYETERIKREEYKQKYLEQKRIYENRIRAVDKIYEKLCQDRINKQGQAAKLEYQQKSLEQAIECNRGNIQLYQEKYNELVMSISAADFDDAKDKN